MTEKRAEPGWLQDLHAVDRAVARQWLAQAGEAQMQRILQAAKPRPTSGAPRKSVPPDWTRLAVAYFLGTNGMTAGEAAGLAARDLHARGVPDGTPENTRRRISAEIEFLRKPRVRDLLRIAPIANEMASAGRTVRSDLFPTAAGRVAEALQRFAETSPALSRAVPRSMPVVREFPVTRLPMSVTDTVATLRVTSFYEAFAHLIDEDTPITTIGRLFRAVEEFVRQEMAAAEESAKTS